MKQTNYQKYVRVTVASGVSSSTTAAIAENEDVLQGVSISEDSERVYYDGKYFSSLIGYTGPGILGRADRAERRTEKPGKRRNVFHGIHRRKIRSGTVSGDNRFRELTVQRRLIVNNVGKELETVEGSLIEPKQGNNVYLSIDYDLQIAVYKILEQRIAGILKQYLRDSKIR